MPTKGKPRKMKSKRQTTRIREKVKKRVREHNRKRRREMKKNGNLHRKPRKDPGIPNMCPFKQDILKEAEDRKRRAEEDKLRRKEDRHGEVMARRKLDQLQKDAERRQKEFEIKLAQKDENSRENKKKSSVDVETSRKAYYREFSKVLDAADVIIQVLDARDPIGSRCTELEQAVLASGTNKRLVLLLNKIDLVPRDNVEKWLKHLRNEFPAIAFKASTQTQRHNLSQSKVPVAISNKELLQGSGCLGADNLIKLLSNYCRNADIKTAITVGVVGFPNVGKSSVINSLRRSKSCSVGATPGVTKTMQEVILAKNIKLLDSPGVVLVSDCNEASMALHNCAKVETLEDPIKPVEAIMRRCNKAQIMLHYNVPTYDSVTEFLALMAKKRGLLKKGGIPDAEKAARRVLNDWNSGKISYFTHVPEQHTLATHVKAEIVSQMSKEFNIDSLQEDDKDTLKDLSDVNPSRLMAMETSGLTSGILSTPADAKEDEDVAEEEDDEEEEEEMDSGEEGKDKELGDVTVSVGTRRSSRLSSVSSSKESKKTKAEQKAAAKQKGAGNQQLNKDNKLAFKKMLKKRKKSDKLATKLSDDLTVAMDFLSPSKGDGDDYDFSKHFAV